MQQNNHITPPVASLGRTAEVGLNFDAPKIEMKFLVLSEREFAWGGLGVEFFSLKLGLLR